MSGKAVDSYAGASSSGGPMRKKKLESRFAPYVPDKSRVRITRTSAESLDIVEGPQTLMTYFLKTLKSNDVFLAMLAVLKRIFTSSDALTNVIIAMDPGSRIMVKCVTADHAGFLSTMMTTTNNPLTCFSFKRIDEVYLYDINHDPSRIMIVDVLRNNPVAVDPIDDDAPDLEVEEMSILLAEYLDVEPGHQNTLVFVSGSVDAENLLLTVTEFCRRTIYECY